MVKKLRRFILKRKIEEKLFWHLRNLNLLGSEYQELTVVEENSLGITFSLKTENQSFKSISFNDIGNEMKLVIDFDGPNISERITFSVSKWLNLTPKTYHIYQKNNNFDIKQKIDFNSGKITLLMTVDENNAIDLKDALIQLMEKIAVDLFKLNTKTLTIISSNFCEKHYWITQEVEKAILKPESTINFSNFHKLKNIF